MFAVAICFAPERATVFFAAAFACANTGKRMAARIAMIAMTTSSSMRVKARFLSTPQCYGGLVRPELSGG